jgi:3-deoxy-manno-octulosonate cytidylyltransferase (CMP-KDO synthetase)
MSVIGIIPARMASTRFPGKPLAKICGIPMIGHIYHRSRMAESLDAVYVATCDREIRDYVESVEGNVVMTSDTHERATDRTAEAVQKIEGSRGEKTDTIVMIQGDEPLVTPRIIDALVSPMREDPKLPLANLMGTIENDREFEDPNVVKVVVNNDDYALYFSREPIPSMKKFEGEIPRYKQFGIIAFHRPFLLKFNRMSPTVLEKIESVDMLRVLEHGYRVKMVYTDNKICSVDTPEDLSYVESIMKNDELFRQYH